jgi:hypothetical protein
LTAARVRDIKFPLLWCPTSADKWHRAKLPENPANIALSGQKGLLINGYPAPDARSIRRAMAAIGQKWTDRFIRLGGDWKSWGFACKAAKACSNVMPTNLISPLFQSHQSVICYLRAPLGGLDFLSVDLSRTRCRGRRCPPGFAIQQAGRTSRSLLR